MLSAVSQTCPPRKRRMKYAAKACTECKRRKIKCSGEEPCRGCITSRNRLCKYPSSGTKLRSNALATVQMNQEDGLEGTNPDGTLPSCSWDYANRLVRTEHENEPDIDPSLLNYVDSGNVTLAQTTHFFSKTLENRLASSSQTGHACPQSQRSIRPLAQHFQDDITESMLSATDEIASSEYILSPIYPDRKFGILLQYWFEELEVFYPCIDRIDFYDRLSTFFVESCSCKGRMTRIPGRSEELSLAALTCSMLCVATYLGAAAEPHQQLQGDDYYINASFSWHLESRRLLNHLPSWREAPNLDVLRLHMLEVIYMTMLGKKGDMSKAMAISVDLAFALQLNDEGTWTSYTPREQEYRRLLWWSVYYMDRRVALKVGRPILINDRDFIVREFSPESREHFLGDHTSTSPGGVQSETSALLIRWPLPAKPHEDWFDYLIFLVGWSTIVSRIWDDFFSLRSHKQADLTRIAVTDGLLAELLGALPSSLTWNPKRLPNVMKMGDMDRTFRFQLIIYETVNMLRLAIRSSTTRGLLEFSNPPIDQSTAQITESIAYATMDSIVSYLNVRNHARPWSTYASFLLVDTTSRIAPFVKSRVAPRDTTPKVIESIVGAQSCLKELANTKLWASSRAAEKLASILEDIRVVYMGTVQRTITVEHSPSENGKPDHVEAGDRNLVDWNLSGDCMEEPWLHDGWQDMLSASDFTIMSVVQGQLEE